MKAVPTAFVLLAVGVAGAAPHVAVLSAEGRSDAVARWEYRVLTKEQVMDLGKKDLAAGLNALGDDGWELVVAEPAFIFKRPKDQARRQAGEVKRRIALIEADVEQLRERAAWAERMARKGFLTEQQVDAERSRLRAAEGALDAAREELKALPADPKGPAGPERKPEK
jgi:hypothetical protein